MGFSDRLKALRKQQGKTTTQCAADVGVTQPAWNQWELGLREPKFDKLREICRLLDCSADELLGLPERGTSVRADKGSMAVNISNNRLDGSIGSFSITSDPPPSCKKCPHLKKLKALEKLMAK